MWALRFTAEWAVIVAAWSIAAQSSNPLAWWAAMLVIGTRQHALAIIGHWAVHGAIAPWLAPACFAPLGISTGAFKAAHWAHHRHVGHDGDSEAPIARRFARRWSRARPLDSVLDALGLHADETLAILRMNATVGSTARLVGFVAIAWWLIGPAALLWPGASITGFMVAHRLRARTEHDHIHAPGTTFRTARPCLAARLIYLPHHTWLHHEHHARPGAQVWAR